MTAPSPTARQTPSGRKLKSGFKTMITMSRLPTASLWEMSQKPTGRNGGDPIDTTTFHNTSRKTKAPAELVETTQNTVKFAYDPKFKTQIEEQINVEQTITTTFRDGSTEAYYGYLQNVEFDDHVAGQMPTGTATFQPTDYDPANNAEAAPAINEVSGT